MKRKLNEKDVPEGVVRVSTPPPDPLFDALGLDARLLQAIAIQKYSVPTPVQSKAIPLALQGRDVVARAKTGSGKTVAYVLPVLQSILKRRAELTSIRSTSALILVPTRELASQVTKAIDSLSSTSGKDIQTINLTTQIHDTAQRVLLASKPDIVVSTPGRASQHLNNSTLVVDNLAHLVIDEADLVLSYGYDDDLRNIVKLIPPGVQTFLASATLTTEVDVLKGLFCLDPVILDLKEAEANSSSVSQYVVRCGEDEKFLLVFALLKLKLIKGKCIIFVGNVDRCYRLKLYLEQFGVKSCVLNSELPVNCRVHVVEEFNKNVYDIIIATDEHEIIGHMSDPGHEQNKEQTEKQPDQADATSNGKPAKDDTTTKPNNPLKKKQKYLKNDREYGISRGIDFQNVACVLNFDFPANSKSYTHRIGRTARAGRPGIALSLVIPSASYRKDKFTTFLSTQYDEAVLAQIQKSQEEIGQTVQPYHFDMGKLEAFRYRVASALKAVSPGAIREARLRELRMELLKSEKLKRHLEENPADRQWLRHDTELRPARVQAHMRHVPDYLMPAGGGGNGEGPGKGLGDVGFMGFVGLMKDGDNRIRNARAKKRMKGKGKRVAVKRSDPLKTFNSKGRGK